MKDTEFEFDLQMNFICYLDADGLLRLKGLV